MPPATRARVSAGPPQSPGLITSRDNRWLKSFRAALCDTRPAEDGCVGLEGVRLVEDALRSGLQVTAVLLSQSGERHLARVHRWLSPAVPLLRTSDRLFAGLADTKTPQGVAALVRPRASSFEDLLAGPAPLVVVLVGVQDPGNVGTVIRSAEAFSATGIAAVAGTANPWMPKAIRASAGSVLRLPVIIGMAPAILLAQLRVTGLKLFAATSSGGLLPSQVDLKVPCAFLIGNEGAGLPDEIVRSADEQVRIPLSSAVDSLNAAVAASVLLYEAARQRAAQV